MPITLMCVGIYAKHVQRVKRVGKVMEILHRTTKLQSIWVKCMSQLKVDSCFYDAKSNTLSHLSKQNTHYLV